MPSKPWQFSLVHKRTDGDCSIYSSSSWCDPLRYLARVCEQPACRLPSGLVVGAWVQWMNTARPPPPDAYSTLTVPTRKHPNNGCRDHVSLRKCPLSCRCPPPTRSWSKTDRSILSDDDGSNVGGSNGSDGRGPEEADCDSDDGEWSDSDDDDSGEEAEGDGRHAKRARPAP